MVASLSLLIFIRMRWILAALICLTAATAARVRRHYAGGNGQSGGHRDRESSSMYCNYYTTNPSTGMTEVASMLCKHGCCGTIDDQECCEDDDDDDDSGGGRSVTYVLVGVLAMAIMTVLIGCVFWFYKKSRARRCKTSHNDGRRTTGRSSGVVLRTQRIPAGPVPPKYSRTDANRAQIFNLFTIPTPTPSYPPPAYAPPLEPTSPPDPIPCQDSANSPPPYSPRKSGSDNPDTGLDVRSPPPPYS